MPRLSRTVFAGIPHHITQRGNWRENVFFTDDDRSVYLDWLKEYCDQYGIDILAYCLMTNHIHLIAVPETDEGLQSVLKPLHMRYAQRISRERVERPFMARAVFLIALGRCLLMGCYTVVEVCRAEFGIGKNGHQSGRSFLVECRGAL